jgi:hypothetical protein
VLQGGEEIEIIISRFVLRLNAHYRNFIAAIAVFPLVSGAGMPHEICIALNRDLAVCFVSNLGFI